MNSRIYSRIMLQIIYSKVIKTKCLLTIIVQFLHFCCNENELTHKDQYTHIFGGICAIRGSLFLITVA